MSNPIRIRFLSKNQFKLAEAQEILSRAGIDVVPLKEAIRELQTDDPDLLVRDKVLQAFKRSGRPLFVEHTGLHIASLNGFPGGLTQVFWDTVQADRFCTLFGNTPDPSVIARTTIAYCDAKTVQIFHGEIAGRIAKEPRGSREFQWDCAFIPDGFAETFSELGPRKNDISMRRRALDALASALKARGTHGTTP